MTLLFSIIEVPDSVVSSVAGNSNVYFTWIPPVSLGKVKRQHVKLAATAFLVTIQSRLTIRRHTVQQGRLINYELSNLPFLLH